jgi:hypothetical protein
MGNTTATSFSTKVFRNSMIAIISVEGSNSALIHWQNQCSGIPWQNVAHTFPAFDFRMAAGMIQQ